MIQTDVRQTAILYWYQMLAVPIASDHWYRAVLLVNRPVRRRAEGALVRIASPVGSSTDPGTILAEQAEFVRVFCGELLKGLAR